MLWKKISKLIHHYRFLFYFSRNFFLFLCYQWIMKKNYCWMSFKKVLIISRLLSSIIAKVLIIINEKSFPSRFSIDAWSSIKARKHSNSSLLSRFIEWTKFFLRAMSFVKRMRMMHPLIYYSARTSTHTRPVDFIFIIIIVVRDDNVNNSLLE